MGDNQCTVDQGFSKQKAFPTYSNIRLVQTSQSRNLLKPLSKYYIKYLYVLFKICINIMMR